MKQEISAVLVSISKRNELNTPKHGADGSSFDCDKSGSTFTWLSICQYHCAQEHHAVLFVVYF
jgi:hypothetical protein